MPFYRLCKCSSPLPGSISAILSLKASHRLLPLIFPSFFYSFLPFSLSSTYTHPYNQANPTLIRRKDLYIALGYIKVFSFVIFSIFFPLALSFCPWEDVSHCLGILTIRPRADTPLILPPSLPLSLSHPLQLDYASLHLAVCCRQILSHKDNLYPFGYRSLDNKYAPLHVNMQDALLLSDICYADVVFMNLCLARYHSNSASCYFVLNYFV